MKGRASATRSRPPRLAVALVLLVAVGLLAGAAGASGDDDLAGDRVVEVVLDNRAALDALVETGADLTHEVDFRGGKIVAQVVTDEVGVADLRAQGYELGQTLWTEAISQQRLAEKAATKARLEAAGKTVGIQSFAALNTDILTVLRVDYFTQGTNETQRLSVEVKSSMGSTTSSSPTITVAWDSGPGTEIGSGGTLTLSRFTDAGAYMYNFREFTVAARPSFVRFTSSAGGEAIAPVEDWLPIDEKGNRQDPYQKSFVHAYLTPQELYDRIEQIHANYPDLTEIIELPHQTLGYQRKAMAAIGPVNTTINVAAAAGDAGIRVASTAGLTVGSPLTIAPGTGNAETRPIAAIPSPAPAAPAPNVILGAPLANAHAVGTAIRSEIAPGNAPATAAVPSSLYVETLEWGHLGGNDVAIELLDPGVADSPLSVFTLGNRVTVNLATNAAGALSSTAAQVVAAINAHPGASALLFARTYAGNAGAGIAQPRTLVNLSDFLAAPASVERGPHTVKLLRIGKHRDGSKTGVFIYAQEHSREWVPPQVTIETAERLLRNYAGDGRTKQLVNNLDIFILPSVNPDGGTYSFYDRTAQRRSMTRHCSLATTSGMPSSRGSWGVDNNRNYDEYSLFDGYTGGSSSCTSDTYSGPAELSEPENKNVDWVPTTFKNIKYSMNTHSSGNYFMWSPGAYRSAGRVLAPRPDLGTESYFWAASSHILTEIKKHRNTAITPARTGPVADVLYSAAGNSGDMMFYKHNLFAWNFETGTAGFQPSFAGGEGSEAWHQTMEFANGMIGLLDVAYAFTKDKQRPETKLVTEKQADGSVLARFTTTEPATIFYTLNGSAPLPSSTKYATTGDREPAETLTLTPGTTVSWYSVDMAGNAENGYKPGTNGANYNKVTVK